MSKVRSWRVGMVVGFAAAWALCGAVQGRAQTDEELRCQAVARTLLASEDVRITDRVSRPGGEAVVTWRSVGGDTGTCAVDASGRIESVVVERRGGSLFSDDDSLFPDTSPSDEALDWEPYLVTCSSERDRRTECKIRPYSKVRLDEQLSRSECTAGTTWGSFGEVLWVDRGCRGAFEVSPLPRWQAYTLTCNSEGGRRKECEMKEGGVARLESRQSRSPCTEGQTWGQADGKVWVDRGCRARFAISPGGGAASPVTAEPRAAGLQAHEACRRQVEALGLSVQQITGTQAVAGGFEVAMRLARSGGTIQATCLWQAHTNQAQLSVR